MFPDRHAHNARMRDHIIKKSTNSGGEKCPEPVSIGDDGFIDKQWPKQLHLEFNYTTVVVPLQGGNRHHVHECDIILNCHAQVPTSFSSEEASLEQRSAISLGASARPSLNQRMMTSINSVAASEGASLS